MFFVYFYVFGNNVADKQQRNVADKLEYFLKSHKFNHDTVLWNIVAQFMVSFDFFDFLNIFKNIDEK